MSMEPPSEDHLDRLFHALANQTRRALLSKLTEGGANISELAEPFAMSMPAISKHIRILERAGLVQRTVSGRIHHCALDARPLATVEEWLTFYRRFWGQTLDALADFVEEGE